MCRHSCLPNPLLSIFLPRGCRRVVCTHFLFCCLHTRASSVLFDVVVAEGLPVFLYVCLLHVVFLVFLYMENGRGVIFFGVFSSRMVYM